MMMMMMMAINQLGLVIMIDEIKRSSVSHFPLHCYSLSPLSQYPLLRVSNSILGRRSHTTLTHAEQKCIKSCPGLDIVCSHSLAHSQPGTLATTHTHTHLPWCALIKNCLILLAIKSSPASNNRQKYSCSSPHPTLPSVRRLSPSSSFKIYLNIPLSVCLTVGLSILAHRQ